VRSSSAVIHVTSLRCKRRTPREGRAVHLMPTIAPAHPLEAAEQQRRRGTHRVNHHELPHAPEQNPARMLVVARTEVEPPLSSPHARDIFEVDIYLAAGLPKDAKDERPHLRELAQEPLERAVAALGVVVPVVEVLARVGWAPRRSMAERSATRGPRAPPARCSGSVSVDGTEEHPEVVVWEEIRVEARGAAELCPWLQ